MLGKQLICIALVGLFSSCATLLNRKTTDVYVQANIDSVWVSVPGDSTHWHRLPTILKPLRSKNDLVLWVRTDSATNALLLESKLSKTFVWGNLLSGFGLVGYGIDALSKKVYTYAPKVDLQYAGLSLKKVKFGGITPVAAGQFNFSVSVPEGNFFYLNQGGVYRHSFGFMGLTARAQYYLNSRYSLSVGAGALTDYMLPFPAPIDYAPNHYSSSSAVFGDMRVARDLGRWRIDAGWHYNRSFYYYRQEVSFTPQLGAEVSHQVIASDTGPMGALYYRITNTFSLGLNYYPSVSVGSTAGRYMHYGHFIFFDLNFRLFSLRTRKGL